MLKVNVKGGNIEKALKILKRKTIHNQFARQLRQTCPEIDDPQPCQQINLRKS